MEFKEFGILDGLGATLIKPLSSIKSNWIINVNHTTTKIKTDFNSMIKIKIGKKKTINIKL